MSRATEHAPERTDVVVIGAGMSGLLAAALLSKAGLDVTVVEAELRPGGYLAGFQRKKFLFDSAIHWLNQCAPGGIVHNALSYLGEDFPVCEPLHAIRRFKGDSFDELLTANPDELKADWLQRFPEDRAGIERFFRDAWVVGRQMTQFTPLMRSTESMGWMQKALHGLRIAKWGIPFMNKYALSAEKGLRKYFKSEGIRRIFATEENFLSIMVPVGWAYHHDFQAPPIGGSVEIPKWLVRRIEANGSRLMLGRRVETIQVEDGRVAGVVLAPRPSRDIPRQTIACRHVISTGDVLTMYEKMLPPGTADEGFLGRLRDMELYSSCVTLSLGLDCPVEELGFGEEMWIVSRDDVPRDQQNVTDPDRCAISILAPSFRDPSVAPPGKGTLTVYTAAEMSYADNWRTGPGLERGEDYKQCKQDFADRVLARVESQLGIDLRSHIEVLDIATPVTHFRYTGNHDGSIMGQRPSRKNIRAKVAHYRTPVDGLLLGGHWAEYGGGVPVATRAAINASILVLQDLKSAAVPGLCRAMVSG